MNVTGKNLNLKRPRPKRAVEPREKNGFNYDKRSICKGCSKLGINVRITMMYILNNF
jgi:hypothetical protein